MKLPDQKAIMAKKTSVPTGLISRRRAMGVMGAAVSAGMLGAPIYARPCIFSGKEEQ